MAARAKSESSKGTTTARARPVTGAAKRKALFSNAPGRSQMAMTSPKRNATISSSALRSIGDDSAATKRRRRNRAQTDKQWQLEAFDYAEKVGELGALLTLQSNIVSLCGFPVRRWDDAQADWVANDPDADDEGNPVDNYDDRPSNVMRAFVGPDGGFIELVRRAAYNLFVAGDTTLLGTKHPKDQGILWEFLSIDELYPNSSGEYVRKRGGAGSGEEPLPADNFTGRCYRSSARFSDLADSEVKRVLPICQEIVTLTMMVDAIAKSRISANLLFIPDELSFSRPGADAADLDDDGVATPEAEEDDADEFVDELFDHMTAPLKDPGSAARLVPLVIRGKGEYGAMIKVIDLSRQLDMWAQELRQEALGRLADGLDAPPEAISGKGNVNHWTAANIDSEFIVKHIQPIGQLIADFITWAYLRPMLEAYEGMSDEEALKFSIVFDPSPVIARADEAKSARDLSDWLSDDAILAANGFTKADMASAETVRVRRLWTLVTTQPGAFGKLLKLIPGFEGITDDMLGSAAPPPAEPAVGPDGTPIEPADEETPKEGADQPTTTEAPRAGDEAKANEMALLVERIATASNSAITKALQTAGNRMMGLAAGKHPDIADRMRTGTRDRRMSLVTKADMATLSTNEDRLLRDAWDDLDLEVRGWVATHLERHGVEPQPAGDSAALVAHTLCESLQQMTSEKLLKRWLPGKNGLRIDPAMVTDILEQAVYAGAR